MISFASQRIKIDMGSRQWLIKLELYNMNTKHLLSITKYFILASVILFSTQTNAQDPHFSQFYGSPLTLNPAIAGTYTGTFRISTIYRDQWRSAVDDPLRTFAASGDVKFNLNYGAIKGNPDIVAVGITFFSDRVNTFDFNTNQILLTAAYHKSLDKKTKQYIGIGIQGASCRSHLITKILLFRINLMPSMGIRLERVNNYHLIIGLIQMLILGFTIPLRLAKHLIFTLGQAIFI